MQRLAVADTDIETTAFARFQFPERVDPVQLAGSDPQGPAVKSRMVVALADVDHVLLHVGCQYEKRLLAAADPQPFALADGIKVGSVMLPDFFAVAHGITVGSSECSQFGIRRSGGPLCGGCRRSCRRVRTFCRVRIRRIYTA